MRYFSLFSGIGGFEHGIEKGWLSLQRQKKLDNIQSKRNSTNFNDSNSFRKTQESKSVNTQNMDCIGYSEIDKYAIQIYKKHYGGHKNYGDARRIKTDKLPDFDFLVGGFPCQAFSIAGKRKGFQDTRGTLFFEIARILRDKRPRYFLLENVKGLLSHDSGQTFQTILGVLSDIGYLLQWEILNSKNFGVPQNRERVFIIGYLGGESFRQVFPIAKSSQGNLKYSARVVSNREKWLKGEKDLSREFSQGQRIYSNKGISQTLAGNAGGQGGKTGLYELAPSLYGFEHGTHKHFNEILPKKLGLIRRLTPTECERLQGFPDGWTEGVSDTQRYKCLGNAVTTNVIEAIIEILID